MISIRFIQARLNGAALRIARDPVSVLTVLIDNELLSHSLIDSVLLRVGAKH